jgi:hypothetical protein
MQFSLRVSISHVYLPELFIKQSIGWQGSRLISGALTTEKLLTMFGKVLLALAPEAVSFDSVANAKDFFVVSIEILAVLGQTFEEFNSI